MSKQTQGKGDGSAIAHPEILSGQHALLGLYPINPKGYSVLHDKVKFTVTLTIGRPREQIGVGQLFVWLAQDEPSMKALFPNSNATAKDWGTKLTAFKLEHFDSLGCQAILRLLPDGKIENIGGFSQLPGVMQSYVRVFFENKEKNFERCDAVGGAQDANEEDRIVNSVKALYECEDPEFTYALPMNDAFDVDRLTIKQGARILTPLEISRRLAKAKEVKNSDFDEDWCRVDQPTIDAFLLRIGREKADVKAEDLIIPPPPKKANPRKSTSEASKASSTSRTTKQEPEESGEDEDDENGTPPVRVPTKRKKAPVVESESESESEDDSDSEVEVGSKRKGKETEKKEKNEKNKKKKKNGK